MKLFEWQDIEGMPHYLSYMSLTLRIVMEGEWHKLQLLSFYGGWNDLHRISISNETKESVVQRLKNYANEIFRLEKDNLFGEKKA
jgi:hypothetical protein